MRGSGVKGRSVARLYSVLALFQYVRSGDSMQDVIASYLSREELDNPRVPDISISDIDRKFFKKLLGTVELNNGAIHDVIVRNLSSNWTVERIDPVALCIIQLGISEILYFRNVPSKVVLNEYSTIASCFFSETNVAFVNGILNSVARLNRPREEFGEETEVNDERSSS